MREIRSQGQEASAMSSHADRYADIAVRQLGARTGQYRSRANGRTRPILPLSASPDDLCRRVRAAIVESLIPTPRGLEIDDQLELGRLLDRYLIR